MTVPPSWLVLLLVGIAGSFAGYLIERRVRRGSWDWARLGSFLLLGVLACAGVFILLTAEREVRTTDYVWSGLAALKGAEILTLLAEKITQVTTALRGPRK